MNGDKVEIFQPKWFLKYAKTCLKFCSISRACLSKGKKVGLPFEKGNACGGECFIFQKAVNLFFPLILDGYLLSTLWEFSWEFSYKNRQQFLHHVKHGGPI